MADSTRLSQFLNTLVACPTVDEQVAALYAAKLFNAATPALILDEVENWLGRNPQQVRQLTLLCEHLAALVHAPAVPPRAIYLRAQTYAINGEFPTALTLIEVAHAAYMKLGMTLEAARTNVGLMNVLNELGDHPKALATAQATLARLQQLMTDAESSANETSTREYSHIMALLHLNSGVAHGKMGQYTEALHSFAQAAKIYRALNMQERVADIVSNRGIILVYMGQIRQALAAFEQAVSLRTEERPSLPHAHTLINMGEAHLLLGNYIQSLQTFEQANDLLEQLDAPIDQQISLLHLADAYRVLNLYPEALAMYREAAQLLADKEMRYERAVALWGIGSILLTQHQYEEADRVLSEAANLFSQANNIPLQSGVLLEQAALQAQVDGNLRALTTARQALHMLTASQSDNRWPVQQIYAHLRLADLLLTDTEAAKIHLLQAEHLLLTVTLPHLRYRLNQRLGRLYRLQGDNSAAQNRLEKAVNEIERLRLTLPHETLRTSFLRDKITAYEELIQLYLDEGSEASVRRAFNMAERAKSRTLVDRLAGQVEAYLDSATESEPESETAVQLRKLQTDLDAVYNQLLAENEGSIRNEESQTRTQTTRTTTLYRQAATLEQEISRHHLRLQSLRSNSSSNPSAPYPFTSFWPLNTIQQRLPQRLAFVAYHIVADEIIAFISIQGRIKVVRQISSVSTIHSLLQKLERHWMHLHTNPQMVERHLKFLERIAQQLLGKLYQQLFLAIEPFLEQYVSTTGDTPGKVAIIPHGLLHQIPFHALYDGQYYLLERYEISYASSAAVLAFCQNRQTVTIDHTLIMGVADATIPAVEAEVTAVSAQLAHAETYLNKAATMAKFSARVSNATVVHLACHGLFRVDNPLFSALKLYDGWLTAMEMSQHDLKDALVVLSACESGRGHVVEGDEVIGLTRACFGAGAAALLVSHWLVQDDTGTIFMTEFYTRLAQQYTLAAAVRTAQLALKSSHPHPYYWAPFVLQGNQSITINSQTNNKKRDEIYT